jgi:hypothetical protein
MRNFFILFFLLAPPVEASIFGEENIALMKIVMGQIAELEKLTEAIGVAKENRDALIAINDGINKVVNQLESIDEIVRRAERLDPRAIKRISDITRLINDTKTLAKDLDLLIDAKIVSMDEAVQASALQSETAYSVGREIVLSGARFSSEARTASPGRAAQISAAASSAQMMATGTLLQTISQMNQMQAIELELKRAELEKEQRSETERKKAAAEFLKRRKK